MLPFILSGVEGGRLKGKERGQGWRVPPSLTPCCEAVPLEAYLVAGFFLASFCLLCFWVFFGDLSPMMVLLSQATPRSLAAYFFPAQGL